MAGFVMVEQVKSVAYRSREAWRIGLAEAALVEEVLAIMDACMC